MITTIHAKRALITAILDDGSEKNVVLESKDKREQTFHVLHKGFVSVVASDLSESEMEKFGIEVVRRKDVNLNNLWLYKPRQLEYFSGHENN